MLAIAAQTGSDAAAAEWMWRRRAIPPGEVLCRTLELGVCGTDREILHSAKPWTPPGEDRLILGHECLARIEAVGAGVTDFRPGDLVVPVVRRGAARPDTARRFAAVWRIRRAGYRARARLLAAAVARSARAPVSRAARSPTWPCWPSRWPCRKKASTKRLLLTRARLGDDAWTTATAARAGHGHGPDRLRGRAGGGRPRLAGDDARPRRAGHFRAQLAAAVGRTISADCPMTSVRAGDIERDGYDLLLECTGSDEVLLAAARLVRSCGVIVWLGSKRVPQPAMHNVQRWCATAC